MNIDLKNELFNVTSDLGEMNHFWEDLRKNLPLEKRDPFFQPAYLKINEHTEGGEARFATFSCPEGQLIYPFLLRPLPQQYGIEGYDITSAYGFGGPSVSGEIKSVLNKFVPYWTQWCKNNDVVAEFIRFHPLLGNHQHVDWVEHHHPKDIIWFDLTLDEESLWKNLHSQKRRYLKKAEAQGLTISSDWQYFENFKALYKDTMDHNQAQDFYYFDDSFFNPLEEALSRQTCWLHTALYENEPVSSALFLSDGDTVHYFLGANSEKARELKSSAWLLFQTALIAKCRGFKKYTLGGGLSRDDSLFKFKQQLSPLTKPYTIGTKVHSTEKYEAITNAFSQARPDADTPKTLLFYRQDP